MRRSAFILNFSKIRLGVLRCDSWIRNTYFHDLPRETRPSALTAQSCYSYWLLQKHIVLLHQHRNVVLLQVCPQRWSFLAIPKHSALFARGSTRVHSRRRTVLASYAHTQCLARRNASGGHKRNAPLDKHSIFLRG